MSRLLNSHDNDVLRAHVDDMSTLKVDVTPETLHNVLMFVLLRSLPLRCHHTPLFFFWPSIALFIPKDVRRVLYFLKRSCVVDSFALCV